MHRTPEYQCWADMWVRCTNPKNKRFKDYGGRGITVCAEWKSFEQFYIDKGRRPGKGFSLDRINNDGPYTPDNTRWATPQEQQNNNRGNRLIDINGVSKNVTQWSLECGLSRMTIYGRLKNGWDPVAAILTPSRCKRNNPQ
jgi:hypothetical protein